MEKPILATNIDGFLINHSAFIEPHRIWFDRVILLTKDNSFNKWKTSKNYFEGVNLAMEKLMPDATKEERTQKARGWYQEDVIHYIKLHPEVVNRQLAESLKKLKEKFTLALITTNTKDYIEKILKTANLEGIYKIIHASETSEEPSKSKIFQEFRKKYGEPKYYMTSRSKEAFEECTKLEILSIYFSQKEIDSEIKKLASRTITNIEGLRILD